ncbi:MAG: type I pullulanase [Bacteroidota bacterium]|nr:type I pullulanase [Bacteroidota bacterium]
MRTTPRGTAGNPSIQKSSCRLALCLLVWVAIPQLSMSQKTIKNPYQDYPVYRGTDLGVQYTPSATRFRVWAPGASQVLLRIYSSGDTGQAISKIPLRKSKQGTWQLTVDKDLKNRYYTFQVQEPSGNWLQESPDIYAKAVGVNGKRGMIVNLKQTDPPGWNHDRRPPEKGYTDIIIYEMHIRDFTIDKNSGVVHKGKYLGLTETGTRGPGGVKTGLDHLKELGITHVHLLPVFDFNSIDESKPRQPQYNWGYDPLNYDVPEGSYSTNPYDGRVRIREFKEMVQALHRSGIRVIMDVVYNHTSNLETPFNQFAPGYYYRHNPDGTYSNATGCGNETASERPMMRKFMIASVLYWVKEYHIDGFRFDLMGVHDIKTMNLISDTLHKIDPTIFLYGEGWTAGASPYPEKLRAVKKNIYLLHRIAAFSDDLRDGLRGPFSDSRAKGFVSGKSGETQNIKFGIVASTPHGQINYQKVSYSKAPWAKEPYQSINYVSCHDDPTLYDRLVEANPGASLSDLIRMDKLAQTVVFTSQGVAFLHSGAELLRTKDGVHNSFQSPDSINEIDWKRKETYHDLFNYYRELIALRKNHPAFSMPSTRMIQTHLTFLPTRDSMLIAYRIQNVKADQWKDILVLINGDTTAKTFHLPEGNWILAADGNTINEKGIRQVTVADIPATTEYVLFRKP